MKKVLAIAAVAGLLLTGCASPTEEDKRIERIDACVTEEHKYYIEEFGANHYRVFKAKVDEVILNHCLEQEKKL